MISRYKALEKRFFEYKTSDKLLSDELHWLRLLVKESRDAIVVLDNRARVYYANSQFADMLGYTTKEIYELSVWDWEIQLTREQILELLNSVDKGGHHFESRFRSKDGRVVDVELSNNGATYNGDKLVLCICRDICDKKQAERENKELIQKLQASLAEIRALRGILPLCSFCKKIRDGEGIWEEVDVYIHKHSEADISHGICPDCLKKHYGKLEKDPSAG